LNRAAREGPFLVTILISSMILVTVIALGSRIANHVQNVKDGFTSNTDASVTDASPDGNKANPACDQAGDRASAHAGSVTQV